MKLETIKVNVEAKRWSIFSNFGFIIYFFLKVVMMLLITKIANMPQRMVIASGGDW